MDNNQIGCFAEYKFATECLERGFNISFPLIDSSVYDCIVDNGKGLYKIQVKSTNKTPANKNTTTIPVPLQNNKRQYTKERVDYFAIWSVYFNGFFIFKNTGDMQLIRISLIGKNSIFFNNFVFN